MGSGTIDFRANERETPTMHFVANETFGAEQTYSVYMRDGYGRGTLLLDNYRYDFIEKTRNDKSLIPLINAYNKLRSNIGSPSDDSLITTEERNDFFKILDTVTSLGFK